MQPASPTNLDAAISVQQQLVPLAMPVPTIAISVRPGSSSSSSNNSASNNSTNIGTVDYKAAAVLGDAELLKAARDHNLSRQNSKSPKAIALTGSPVVSYRAMYGCVRVCVHVRMCVCLRVYEEHVCVDKHMSVWLYVLYTCMHVCVYLVWLCES